ncbi:YihD family protein [Endozoicomonas arenosclerae]|uniref:YihD family protein n=1 Tax=Endozoicomonas arenosclerae TaxID=1633495 RepID=UPI000780F19E|nr:YihD family protein [Endozoicomonas arenosclerae]
MSCHKINELFELLAPEWNKEAHLNLVEVLKKLAEEAGHKGDLSSLTDDTLIYHLKMKGEKKDAMIPGIAKDAIPDFKEALLKARGIK